MDPNAAVFLPEGFYRTIEVANQLGVSYDSIVKGRRKEGLRYVRVGNRTHYKGAWVLEWLERKSVVREPAPPA